MTEVARISWMRERKAGFPRPDSWGRERGRRLARSFGEWGSRRMGLLFLVLVLEGVVELEFEGASSSAARMNCVMRVETAARSCEHTD